MAPSGGIIFAILSESGQAALLRKGRVLAFGNNDRFFPLIFVKLFLSLSNAFCTIANSWAKCFLKNSNI